MTYDQPPTEIPATPEFILAVIRDQYRQQCQFDDATEPDVDLTFHTTIADWRTACDLLEWRALGRALDREWNLGHSDAAWRAILKPPHKRTLRDLSEFIAQRARQPVIESLHILGKPCRAAGTFLAIRSLLRDAGADVTAVKPSTPLDVFTKHHVDVFLGPISRLAPNALPEVKVSTPWYDLGALGLSLTLLPILLGCIFFPPLAAAAGVLAAVFYILTWLAARRAPSQVQFGNLQTFRDLAQVVAAEGQITVRR